MEYVRATQLLTRQARAYFSDVIPLAHETIAASAAATLLFLRLLAVLLRPLLTLTLHLHRVLTPLTRSTLIRLWHLFRLQPPHILAAEAFLASCTLLLVVLERRFALIHRIWSATRKATTLTKARYRAVLESVRAKSRLAAAALPHVLFLAMASGVHLVLGRHITALTTAPAMLVLACMRPAVRTLLVLYTVHYAHPPSPLPRTPEAPPEGAGPPLVMRAMSAPPERRPVRRRPRAKSGGAGDADPDADPAADPDADAARRRARAVADEIENDGAGLNVLRSTVSPVKEKERTPVRRARPLRDEEEDSASRERTEEVLLRFWVVFGLLWASRSVAWYVCPSMLQHFVAGLDTALLYVLLWAQLGLTRGADIMYAAVASAARRRWRLDTHGAGRDSDGLARLNVVLRLAVATGLVSAGRAEMVADAVEESGLALVGVVFLITPRVVTFVGTVAVGLVVPCYVSTGVLETKSAAGLARHNWLAYWVVVALVEAGFTACADVLGWLPLWYHVKMVVVLWLQLPYYRGAVVVLDRLMGRVGVALSSVRREIVTPMKRKRA